MRNSSLMYYLLSGRKQTLLCSICSVGNVFLNFGSFWKKLRYPKGFGCVAIKFTWSTAFRLFNIFITSQFSSIPFMLCWLWLTPFHSRMKTMWSLKILHPLTPQSAGGRLVPKIGLTKISKGNHTSVMRIKGEILQPTVSISIPYLHFIQRRLSASRNSALRKTQNMQTMIP